MVAMSARLSAVVGDRSAKPLATHLGLHTVGDLLRHYPRRYVERGALTPFDELVLDEFATVFAVVDACTGRMLLAARQAGRASTRPT